MGTNLPLVSIAMPAYNAERYIARTIESLLSQTYTNFELLIQDDASTDRTCEIVLSFDDPRIKLERNESNKDVEMTRNILMDRANGKYLAIADSDDIYMPDRLHRQVKFMERHPEISVCGSHMAVIDQNGKQTKSKYKYPITNDRIMVTILFASPFGNPSAMLRLQPIMDNNFRYKQITASGDMVFWSEIVGKLKCANIPKILVKYRVWGGQISSTSRVKQANHALDASLSKISLLGAELSEAETGALHKIMFEHNSILTLADVELFKDLITKIWYANRQSQVLRKRELLAELLMRYKRAYRKMSKNRFKTHLNTIKLLAELLHIN